MLCCGYTLTDFPISIRLTSLALWQSNDCPSASKATLMNMDKYFMWIHYERLHNHNKAKHNKPCAYFVGYTVCQRSLSTLHSWLTGAMVLWHVAISLVLCAPRVHIEAWWGIVGWGGWECGKVAVRHMPAQQVVVTYGQESFNTLKENQYGWHFAHCTSKCVSFIKCYCVLIQTSLTFVSKGSIHDASESKTLRPRQNGHLFPDDVSNGFSWKKYMNFD